MVETMKDYLETMYSQSIFIDSLDYAYSEYIKSFTNGFKDEFQTEGEVFMGKILTLIYRLRERYLSIKVEVTGEEEKVPTEEPNPPVEESKVVEIEDNNQILEASSTAQTGQGSLESLIIEESKSENDENVDKEANHEDNEKTLQK